MFIFFHRTFIFNECVTITILKLNINIHLQQLLLVSFKYHALLL